MGPLSEAVFDSDTRGQINSAEIFLNRSRTCIVNSEGLDVSYTSYQGHIELITEWTASREDVELCKEILFSDFEPQRISDAVREQLRFCRRRGEAVPTPSRAMPVLLTGEPVREFFQYYLAQSSAKYIYKGISSWTPGTQVQDDACPGKSIALELDPFLAGSTLSAPWDNDGWPLERVAIIQNGRLERHWGPLRFCHYIGAEPAGSIGNVVIGPGKESCDALRGAPCLEVVSFSDFQCDPLTGDFGGEIRLAFLNERNGDGGVPVSGGSVSGNVLDARKALALSSETQLLNGFHGPRTVRLENVRIAGAA